MPKSLKRKINGLLMWLIVFCTVIPSTVYAASRTVDVVTDIKYAGSLLLMFAIFGGAGTAMFIPTAVDEQLRYKVIAKIFIGLSFGTFSALFASSYYKLDDIQMLLPAYLLAAIGTPLMVYVVGIAADKDTYVTIMLWLKKRFGMGGN